LIAQDVCSVANLRKADFSMLHSTLPTTGWQPSRTFWAWHLWAALLAASVALIFMENSNLDLWMADQWYALQGGQWAWRSHWVSYELIHHYGKQLIIGIGLTALVLIVLSYIRPGLRNWRAPMSYLLTTMAVVPTLIATFKKFSPVDCPWSLLRYGGDLPYVRTFEHSFGLTDVGRCFPAGHASGGFILLAMYFAALPFVKHPARYLLPGVIVGWIFALGQQSRGAHFLSHDLWTLSVCWFGALGMFLLFRPSRWPGPTHSTSPADHAITNIKAEPTFDGAKL
jgi:membrane-associated PAP2 superfamily phosphatase